MKTRAFPFSIRAAAVAAIALCAVSASHGATWYVSPTGTGDGKSENSPMGIATGFAKANGTGDEVVIQPGTYVLTAPVAANGKGSVVRGATGKPEDVVLDAQGQFHVMRIAGDILVHSLTVANGVTNAYNGGTSSGGAAGIRIGSNTQSTRSVVSNCVVRGCYNSSDSSQACGAVVMFKNSLLVDSWITNNTAYYVCAGVNVGQAGADATIRGCVIAENKPSAGQSNGTLHGIGLCMGVANGTVTVEDTEIKNNVSGTGGAGAGFAIRQNGCSAEFVNCVFSGNSNANGGAIGVNGSSSATFDGCSFTDNVGIKNGGAARIYNGAALTFTDCTFTGNESPLGGAIYQEGGAEQAATRIFATDCRFVSNVSTNGGAVAVTGVSRFVADGCTFESNVALNAGDPGNTGKVESNVLKLDQGKTGGGAIYLDTVTNKTSGVWGGCWVSNSVFGANSANSYGGAVSHTAGGHMVGEFVNCVFTNNTGVTYGGAIFMCDPSNAGRGKSYYSTRNGADPFLVRQCLFAGNAVYDKITSGTAASGNVANGGALYFVSDWSPAMESCTLVGNNAISSNSSQGKGGAVYHKWGGAINNTIIADNKIQSGTGTALKTDSSDWGSAGANCNNCVHPDSNSKNASTYFKSENGNLFVDPKFADAENGDWRLADDSPCKGKGLNEPWMAGALDLAGIARIQGDNVDIGAYEVFIPAAFTLVIR